MLLTALTLLLAQAPTAPAAEVLIHGNRYHEGDVATPSGTPALELCDDQLVPTTVRFVRDPIDPRLLRLAPSGCDAPVVLAGFGGLQAGPVHAATLTRDRGAVVARLGAVEARLRVTPFSDGGVRATLDDDPVIFESAAPESEVELLWIGDLDRDGKLDVLLRATEGLLQYGVLHLSDGDDPAVQTITPTS